MSLRSRTELARSAAQRFRAVDDVRGDENDKLAASVVRLAMLKENAQDRDISEERDLIEVASRVARVNASDDRGMPVHDQEIGFRFSLENRRSAVGSRLVEVGLVACELHVHRNRAIRGDVRLDQQLQLCLLERRLDAESAHLRVRNESALVDPRFPVVDTNHTRGADDAHEATRFRRRSRKARFSVLSIDPNASPSAPPDPVPTAAGKFTAKLGVPTVFANGERPAVGVLLSEAPPAAVTVSEMRSRRIARCRAEGDVTAPLNADVARVVARTFHDARLDKTSAVWRIERANELFDVVQVAATSRAMRTLVRSSTASEPRGESKILARALELGGVRVADRDEAGLEGRELVFLFLLRDA